MTVLVLRPPPQGPQLTKEIEALGGTAIYLPTLQIEPSGLNPELSATLDKLTDYNTLVFVSRPAVEYFLKLVPDADIKLGHCEILAMGSTTAATLRKQGLSCVSSDNTNRGSEALLELAELQDSNVKGKRVLVVRGVGGLELLADTLVERGAEVDYAEVYRRTRPSYDADQLQKSLTQPGPDIIVGTSEQSLDNLLALCDARVRRKILKTDLVVISERLRVAAGDLGFSGRTIVSNGYSNTNILAALCRYAGNTQ